MEVLRFVAHRAERSGLWQAHDVVEVYVPGHATYVNGTAQRTRYGRIMAAVLAGHLQPQPLQRIPVPVAQSAS